MAKGYWIVHIDVTNPEDYETYRKANGAPLAKFGGTFLVRGGTQELHEGQQRPRTVVIEFPDYEAAKACYTSAEYQAVKALRANAADSDLVIVEGYSAEQP